MHHVKHGMLQQERTQHGHASVVAEEVRIARSTSHGGGAVDDAYHASTRAEKRGGVAVDHLVRLGKSVQTQKVEERPPAVRRDPLSQWAHETQLGSDFHGLFGRIVGLRWRHAEYRRQEQARQEQSEALF